MNAHIITNGGRAPEVSDTHVVALYHPDTGKIVHLHTVTVFKGGRVVTEKEAIDAAVANALKVGHQTEHLKVKTSKDPAHGRSPHRIDLDSGRFIAVPPKAIRKS